MFRRHSGRLVVWLSSALGVASLSVAPGVVLAVGAPGSDPTEERSKSARDPLLEEDLDIGEGEILVADLLHYLSDRTGLPVIVDVPGTSGWESVEQSITLASPVKSASVDVVIALLEANRIAVERDELPSGSEVLRVARSSNSCSRVATGPTMDEPTTTFMPSGRMETRVPVFINSGTIEVVQLFQFLADHSGLNVIVDARQSKLAARSVVLAVPIMEADDEVVIALLEASGFSVKRETMENGEEVLKVSLTGSVNLRLDASLQALEDELEVLRAQVGALRSALKAAPR